MAAAEAIRLENIRKTFGSVVANDDISIQVNKGEILCLLGENGSGKTTLMNMLSGIYKPESGSIFLCGEKVVINSPEDSKRMGIGMVHQHFKLVESFTAAENILIGSEHGERAILKKADIEKIKITADSFGFDIDLNKKISDMSVSEKQTVEILKVLYYGADVLILDEPTAVLTLQETRRLFAVLRQMRDKGCALIIITHKLNEVMEISDRVTILRKGQSVGTVVTAQTTAKELTDLMVGRSVELAIDHPEIEPGEELLKIENLNILNEDGAKAINDVSFFVRSGEILGVAGVSGCGQKELCEAIAGLHKIESGKIFFRGENIEHNTPKQIIQKGISMSFIPEDRLGMGLAGSLSITDNMILKTYGKGKTPFVDRKSARALAGKVIDELQVVCPGAETPVRRLSGGNVQKVLVGREIESEPKVIVTAYPVRGLDINSSYAIYNILNREKKNGTGVLFVGEDLDVMLELCDRIIVLCHGELTGTVKADETNKEELGLLMTGGKETGGIGTRFIETEKLFGEESSENIDKPYCGESEKEAEIKDAADEAILVNDTKQEAGKKSAGKSRKHEPFIKIGKRDNLALYQTALLYMAAILAALVAGGIFIAASGMNPVDYYIDVVQGSFKSPIRIKGLLQLITPLVITALGISYAFKMRFWNIGGNGQFLMGALAATTASLAIGDSLPQWMTLIIMAVAGGIGGGLFGLIPALLKVKFGTNETLLTLMLNYIALYLVAYLKNVYFFIKVDDTGKPIRPDYKILPESGHMFNLKIGNVSFDASLIIAVVLVVLTFLYFKYAKQGYEISIIGDSKNTALYAGMSVSKIMIRTMIISSVLIGIAGMFEVSGQATSHTLSEGIAHDVGWTGIIVAWLSKLNPFGILVTAFLMCVLEQGSSYSASSDIIQGIILFTILAADFFVRYKIKFNLAGKGKKKKEAAA